MVAFQFQIICIFRWRHGRHFVKSEAALSRPQFCFDFLQIWYTGSLTKSRKWDCISAFYVNNFYPIWRPEVDFFSKWPPKDLKRFCSKTTRPILLKLCINSPTDMKLLLCKFWIICINRSRHGLNFVFWQNDVMKSYRPIFKTSFIFG